MGECYTTIMKHVYAISLPGYHKGSKPDCEYIGKLLDDTIKAHFMSQHIAIRALSLQDHPDKSTDDLITIISETGTDKYDPARKMSVAHDFYTDKGVEIFATPVKVTDDLRLMNEVLKDFYEGALGDRGYSLKIDLLVIYDFDQLVTIPIRYDDGVGKEAFKFKDPDKKSNTLRGFIKII